MDNCARSSVRPSTCKFLWSLAAVELLLASVMAVEPSLAAVAAV
jgi:hypothetical protein